MSIIPVLVTAARLRIGRNVNDLSWAAAAEAAAFSPFKVNELTESICYYGRNG